eukprot:683523-Prorocentrum_minimum.AAC.1
MPVGVVDSVRASIRWHCACPNRKCARMAESTFGMVKVLRHNTTTGHGVPRTKTRPGPPCSPTGLSVLMLKAPSVLMEKRR